MPRSRFDYDGRRVPARCQQPRHLRPAKTAVCGARPAGGGGRQGVSVSTRPGGSSAGLPGRGRLLRLAPKKLPAVAHACLAAGWHVEAEGKIFRRPGAMHVGVSSGIDWFELHGEVDYGGATAKLPALLAALRRGENMVRLDDGTYGLLPEEWLTPLRPHCRPGHRRGRSSALPPQPGGLAGCAAGHPAGSRFATPPSRACATNCATSAGIRAGEQPEGFVGQLRDYQRDGVGWMDFLRRFGFGGCLADDMGVGKTAQVLALLEARRASQRLARSVAGGGAAIAGLQLEAGGRALHAQLARARSHRPGARRATASPITTWC